MITPVTVYLSAGAQTQLDKLIAVNKTRLTKLDTRGAAATAQQASVVSLTAETTKLRNAVAKLSNADPTARPAALQSFVDSYNSMAGIVSAYTAKGATLHGAREVSRARTDLRTPFLSTDVTAALKAAGVSVSATGLAFSGAPGNGVALDAVVSAFGSTLNGLQSSISFAGQRLTNQQTGIAKERARTQVSVDKQNAVTTKSFLKYYQTMQAMQGATGSTSQTVSLFG